MRRHSRYLAVSEPSVRASPCKTTHPSWAAAVNKASLPPLICGFYAHRNYARPLIYHHEFDLLLPSGLSCSPRPIRQCLGLKEDGLIAAESIHASSGQSPSSSNAFSIFACLRRPVIVGARPARGRKALGPYDDGPMKVESKSRINPLPSPPLPLLVRFGRGLVRHSIEIAYNRRRH